MEKIGYLGPDGSYSRLAAERMRPNAQLLAYPSFPLVMKSLTSLETDAIVVPIENSLNGGVLQNMDLLQGTDGVVAVEERVIKIRHCLITLKGADISKIQRIYSHTQALEQCANYLSQNFPYAKLIPTQSTSSCLEKIKSFEDAGIVGAHIIREGLEISDFDVADNKENFTHFLLVRRGGIKSGTHSGKIYFTATCINRSGALLSLLNCISAQGLNMTKLQSRPIKISTDEYRFFIEIEGDYADARVHLALDDIKKKSKSFKLLGCY